MMRNIITPKPSLRPNTKSQPQPPKSSPSSSSLASGVNPFFSRPQHSLVRTPKSSSNTTAHNPNASHHDLLEEDAVEVDAEELALITNDEHGQQQQQKGNGKSSRWKKFLPGGDERAENPFLGAKERERGEEMSLGGGRASPNPKKGKGKTAHFQGAEVVRKPSDAFERGPSG